MKTTKVTVTALKAPWPEGVQLGHVVSFKGEPPAWALGKFAEAPEGAKTDFAHEPPELVGDGIGAALLSTDAAGAAAQYAGQAQAFIEDLRAKHDAELEALRKQNYEGGEALREALDGNAALQTELAAAKEDAQAQRTAVADLRAKLDDAEKALAAQKPAGGKRA